MRLEHIFSQQGIPSLWQLIGALGKTNVAKSEWSWNLNFDIYSYTPG